MNFKAREENGPNTPHADVVVHPNQKKNNLLMETLDPHFGELMKRVDLVEELISLARNKLLYLLLYGCLFA